MINISPIFYMGNKKKLIQKGLIDLFPKDIKTFYDLFAGSGIVSMNVKADEYVVNDINPHLCDLYSIFEFEPYDKIIEHILSLLNQYDLPRKGVPQKTSEHDYYKSHYFNLRKHCNITKSPLDLYTCMFYAFSQQMRFNNKGEFNMPFGNGAFTVQNEEYIKNGCDFFNNSRVWCTSWDYREHLIGGMRSNDFVYLDPPYFNTTATYNENQGWTKQDEEDLHNFCEMLNRNGIKFGLSNVFANKGVINQQLIDWCDKNKWSVAKFGDFDYYACGKGGSKTQEVYIYNY